MSPTKQINASRLMGFLDLNISPAPHLDRLVVVIHEHYWRMLSMAHGPKVGSVVVQSSTWVKALTSNVMLLTSTWSAVS